MQQARGVSGVTLVAAFWLTGLALGRLLAPPLWLALTLAGALLLVTFLLRSHRAVPLLLLFAALGAARLDLPIGQRSLQHILDVTPSFQQPIEGVILSGPEPREHSYRYELKLTRTAGERIHGRVLLYADRDDLLPGDCVATLAQVQQVWKRANFETFDFEESLAARGIHGVAFARGVLRVESPGRGPRAWIGALRRFIGDRIDARCGEHAPLVRSFLLGQVDDEDDTREVLRRAGLAHLLAVSGLHVAILWLVFWLLTRIFLPRPAARLTSLAILIVYAALCAWRPSVTRAVVMLGVMVLGSLWQRRQTLLHSLSLAALLVTLIQPLQLFTPGFQLSYLAVLSLAVLIPVVRFTDKESPRWRRVAQAAVELAVSSAGIALALAPVTLHHFHSVSFNGIVANLVALPLFTLTLPAAMLAAMVPTVPLLTPALQSGFFLLADTLLAWARLTSRLPLVWEQVAVSSVRAALLLGALACLAVMLRARGKRWRITAATLMCALLVAAIPLPRQADETLRVTFAYAGMADMTLLETPDGHTIFIDTGPMEGEPGYVAQSLAPYMAKRGIRAIDAMFITHAHDDHYGGARALCEMYAVREIVADDETVARLPLLDSLAMAEGCPLVVLADTTTFHWGEVSLRVLHPDSGFHAETVNDESLTLRLDYREFSALFTGDIESPSEEWLLACRPGLLDCDVLKVAHHGSATSSTPDFLRAVSPEYAFISVPTRNVHHLPDAITLDRLSSLGENLFISGRDGALRIDTDGRRATLTAVLREESIEDASLE